MEEWIKRTNGLTKYSETFLDRSSAITRRSNIIGIKWYSVGHVSHHLRF